MSASTYSDSHTKPGKGREYDEYYGSDAWARYLWSREQDVLAQVLDEFLPGRSVHALDFACGTGRISSFLEQRVASCTGVDVSEAMLGEARKKLERTTLHRANLMESSPFERESFDLITAFRFFVNAEPGLRKAAVRALAPLLKPDGVLVFNDHQNINAPYMRLARAYAGFRGFGVFNVLEHRGVPRARGRGRAGNRAHPSGGNAAPAEALASRRAVSRGGPAHRPVAVRRALVDEPDPGGPAQGVTLLALLLLLAACSDSGPREERPGEWPELGGGFRGEHHSKLTQIDAANAHTLGFAWEYEARSRRGRVEHGQEATPIVVGGVLYVSGPWGSVFAVDAKTGAERWRYDPQVDGSYARRACCDVVNRGVQVWNGRVYVGTLDGFLVALEAQSGKELWRVDTLIDRDTRFYTITGPPKVAKDVVVIGNSGAEFGVRGYVTAYDLESGAERWRFFTVPGDPAENEPEHPELERALATWDPSSDWKSGLGGTVWGELVYDPELELLYVGTGNGSPYPVWLRSPSGGDNLYLASILALDPDDGRMVWHYQTTPGEMLGLHRDAEHDPGRARDRRSRAPRDHAGAEERLLLRARPRDGPVHLGRAVRVHQLGQSHRRERAPGHEPARGVQAPAGGRVSRGGGRAQLAADGLQSRDRPGLHPRARAGHADRERALLPLDSRPAQPRLEGDLRFERGAACGARARDARCDPALAARATADRDPRAPDRVRPGRAVRALARPRRERDLRGRGRPRDGGKSRRAGDVLGTPRRVPRGHGPRARDDRGRHGDHGRARELRDRRRAVHRRDRRARRHGRLEPSE